MKYEKYASEQDRYLMELHLSYGQTFYGTMQPQDEYRPKQLDLDVWTVPH